MTKRFRWTYTDVKCPATSRLSTEILNSLPVYTPELCEIFVQNQGTPTVFRLWMRPNENCGSFGEGLPSPMKAKFYKLLILAIAARTIANGRPRRDE
jgi:hypothetical protein